MKIDSCDLEEDFCFSKRQESGHSELTSESGPTSFAASTLVSSGSSSCPRVGSLCLPEGVSEIIMRDHFPTVAESLRSIRLRSDEFEGTRERAEFDDQDIEDERYRDADDEPFFSGFDTVGERQAQRQRFLQLQTTLRGCSDKAKVHDFASLVSIGALIFKALTPEK
ncbi:unnamed protein product [Amoebophrya sp. A25]|nr:unnamed protein product [Amoebophrya sp. A25]|eukprot:GSA25T00003092001.1